MSMIGLYLALTFFCTVFSTNLILSSICWSNSVTIPSIYVNGVNTSSTLGTYPFTAVFNTVGRFDTNYANGLMQELVLYRNNQAFNSLNIQLNQNTFYNAF